MLQATNTIPLISGLDAPTALADLECALISGIKEISPMETSPYKPMACILVPSLRITSRPILKNVLSSIRKIHICALSCVATTRRWQLLPSSGLKQNMLMLLLIVACRSRTASKHLGMAAAPRLLCATPTTSNCNALLRVTMPRGMQSRTNARHGCSVCHRMLTMRKTLRSSCEPQSVQQWQWWRATPGQHARKSRVVLTPPLMIQRHSVVTAWSTYRANAARWTRFASEA